MCVTFFIQKDAMDTLSSLHMHFKIFDFFPISIIHLPTHCYMFHMHIVVLNTQILNIMYTYCHKLLSYILKICSCLQAHSTHRPKGAVGVVVSMLALHAGDQGSSAGYSTNSNL